MPDNFTYMLNLKKMNKQAEQKQIHRYRGHFDCCQIGEGLGEWVNKEIKKYKVVVTE